MTRDHISGKMTVEFPRWHFDHAMTVIHQRSTSEGFARIEITGNNLFSAKTECGTKVAVHRADVVAGHQSGIKMTCDATHFHLTTWAAVTQNGRTILRRAWQQSFPRDTL